GEIENNIKDKSRSPSPASSPSRSLNFFAAQEIKELKIKFSRLPGYFIVDGKYEINGEIFPFHQQVSNQKDADKRIQDFFDQVIDGLVNRCQNPIVFVGSNISGDGFSSGSDFEMSLSRMNIEGIKGILKECIVSKIQPEVQAN